MSKENIPYEDNVIGQPRFTAGEVEPQDLGNIGDGTIGTAPRSAGINNKKEKFINKSSETAPKMALYSEKNLTWSGVGSLVKGYNFLNKNVAEKWLTKTKHVRIATPEEVAKEYGL